MSALEQAIMIPSEAEENKKLSDKLWENLIWENFKMLTEKVKDNVWYQEDKILTALYIENKEENYEVELLSIFDNLLWQQQLS